MKTVAVEDEGESNWTIATVLLGVIFPAVLFVIDHHMQMLMMLLGGKVQFAMRACVGLGMGTMLVWLWQRGRSENVALLLAPMLAFGTMTAFFISIVLLPFALIGVLASGIGLLGLFPIGTLVVFARAWNDAMRRSGRPRWSLGLSILACGVLGCAVVLVLAYGPVASPDRSLWSPRD